MLNKKLFARNGWVGEYTRIVDNDKEITYIIAVRERQYIPYAERLIMELRI